MRFIIHELPYETPLAAGRWRYERAGVPTGALESWRLTAAHDGYQFLRVDLDASRAPSGRSSLYHLTLDERGRPAQLRYRLWSAGPEITGNVVFEASSLIVISEQGDKYQEQVLDWESEALFWYPASTALGQLATLPDGTERPAVTLRLAEQDRARPLEAIETMLSIEHRAAEEAVGQILHPRLLQWPGDQRTVWVDEAGWPQRMARPDGLTAVETRLVVYGNRISEPGDDGR